MYINVVKVNLLSSSEKKTLFFSECNIRLNEEIENIRPWGIGEHVARKHFAKFIKEKILYRKERGGVMSVKPTDKKLPELEVDLKKLGENYDLLKHLSGNEMHMLLALYTVGGKRTNKYLAEYTGTSTSTVSRCLRRLEKDKFIIKIVNTTIERDSMWELKLVKRRVIKYEKFRKSNKSYLKLERLGLNLTKIDKDGFLRDLNYVDSSYTFEDNVILEVRKCFKYSIDGFFEIHKYNSYEQFNKIKDIFISMLTKKVAMRTGKKILEIETHYGRAIERYVDKKIWAQKYNMEGRMEEINNDLIKKYGMDDIRTKNIDFFEGLF